MSRLDRIRAQKASPARSTRRGASPRPPRLKLAWGESGPGTVADRLGPIAIAGTVAVLAWIAFAHHPVGDYFTESDFYGGYSIGARLLRRGVVDVTRYGVAGPIYEMLLAALSFVIRDLFTAARVLSVAASAVTLWSFYKVLERRFDATAGLWTVLLLAVNPVFLRYGFSATTDATASALQAAALLAGFGLAWRRSSILSGALAGLATLTRYTAVAWTGGLMVAQAWEPIDRAARVRRLAGFVAGFLLVVAPWSVFSISRGHVPGETLIQNFSGFFANPNASRNLQDRPIDEVAPPEPATHRPSFPAAALDHLRRDLLETVGARVAVLCGLGAIALTVARRWRKFAPFGLAGFANFIAVSPVFYSDRYSLPHLPVLLALAGIAVALVRIEWSLGARRLPLGWALAAVMLGFGARSASFSVRDVLSQCPIEVLEAGRVLNQVAPPGARVVTRKPHIAYYAGRTSVPFPRLRTMPELAVWCREQGADYLFVSLYEAEMRPEFWALLDTTRRVPGLTVLHVTDHYPSVLYRIGPEFGQVPEWFANEATRNLQAARAQVRVLPPEQAWEAHVLLGLEALDRGAAADAEAHFLAASHTTGGRERGWLGWGEARLRLHHPDDAIRAFETVLSTAPDNRLARERLGMAQWMSGNLAAAAATWKPSIETTRDPQTLQVMLSVYQQVGDEAAAARVRAAMAR